MHVQFPLNFVMICIWAVLIHETSYNNRNQWYCNTVATTEEQVHVQYVYESVLYSTEMKSTCRSGAHISVLMGDTGILTVFRLGTHHVRAHSNYIHTIYFYGFNLCDWRINTLSTGGGIPCQFSYY